MILVTPFFFAPFKDWVTVLATPQDLPLDLQSKTDTRQRHWSMPQTDLKTSRSPPWIRRTMVMMGLGIGGPCRLHQEGSRGFQDATSNT